MKKTEDQIIEEAAQWAARLASPDCTVAERKAFEHWRAADPSHDAAFAAAERVNSQLLRYADSNAELLAMANAAFAAGAPQPRRQRWLLPAALAAGVALVGVLVSAVPFHQLGAKSVAYATTTAVDGRRSVTLEDGTVAELDVGSEIRVEISDKARNVELTRGRALFAVAHDASRPFSVTAGDATTVALGTHFQVEQRGDAIDVTLIEGSVSVTGAGALIGHDERLAPGEQVHYAAQPQAWVKRSVDLQVATSWSNGRLVFHGTPLGVALDEVNRYASKPVRLGDPDLARLPVNGNFIAGDSALVVSALERTLPIEASEREGEILLNFRAD